MHEIDIRYLRDGLTHLRTVLTGDARDWTANSTDAATHAVLFGITDTDHLSDLAQKHHWDIADLLAISAAARSVKTLLGGHPSARPAPIRFTIPHDAGRRKIGDGLTIALDDNGTPVRIPDGGVIVISQLGWGKSVLIHDMIASVVQTDDAVAWLADTDGGQFVAPWIRPDVSTAVDWAAIGERETLRMLNEAMRLITLRTNRFSAPLRIGDDLDAGHVPSPTDPTVYIFCEIDADTSTEVVSLLAKIQRVGAALGFRVVISTTRAAGLPMSLRKLMRTKIAGALDSAEEYAYLFNSPKVDTSSIDRPGRFVAVTTPHVRPDTKPICFTAPLIQPTDILDLSKVVQNVAVRGGLTVETNDGEPLSSYRHRWAYPEIVGLRTKIAGL